jgi:hypothetical protein
MYKLICLYINVNFNSACVAAAIRVYMVATFRDADPSGEQLLLYTNSSSTELYSDYNWRISMEYYRGIYSDYLWMRNCYIPSYPRLAQEGF